MTITVIRRPLDLIARGLSSFRNHGEQQQRHVEPEQLVALPPLMKPHREVERAEIHLLAQGLGLVTRNSRSPYERAIAAFFNDKRSSSELTDSEHTQFLAILRAWAKCKAVMIDRAAFGGA